jgi:hypothetical protein
LKQPSLYTIRCTSLDGTLLGISESDFNLKIRKNEESLRQFEKVCEAKAKYVAKSLLTENSFLNQKTDNKSTFIKMNVIGEEDNEQIKQIEL